MSKMPNRTKLVTFRLSETEYDAVQQVCSAIRAGSVSEFARSAIFRYIDQVSSPNPVSNPPIQAQLEVVTVQLQTLSTALGQLRTCMATALEPKPGANGRPLEVVLRPVNGMTGEDGAV